MTNSRNGSALLLASTASLMLTACGGGDRSDSSDDTVTVPSSGVSISSNNAQRIGAAVVSSMDTLQGRLSRATALTTISAPSQTARFYFPDFTLQQLRRAPGLDPLPGGAAGKAVSQTLPCPDGGSINLSGEVADQSTLTVDDVIDLSFSSCNVTGYLSNGSVAITVTQVVGSNGNRPFVLGAAMTLSDLAISYEGITVTSDGDMSVVLDADTSGDNHLVFSGDTLTSTSSTGQTARLTQYLCDIQIRDATGEYRIAPQGSLASTAIDGSVSFTTITPFIGNAFVGNGAPTEGQVHITTDADNSQAWLTAQLDGTHVVITIDRDGNDIVDEDGTITTTWVDLQNSL